MANASSILADATISLSSQHIKQLVIRGQNKRVKLELGGQLLQSLLRAFSLPLDPDIMFLLICVVIFIGSLLAGAVPFVLRVSEQQLELLSAFGAGLLVSTALAVVLPEGVEAFHSAEGETGTVLPHGAVGLAVVAGFAVMLVVDQAQGGSGHIRHVSRSDSEDELNDTERGLVLPERSRVLKKHQDPGSRALIGLLVHSLADGVAVGTTGISDKEELKLIVAFAMVLHKLPATFGLVTFLMASKWSAQSTGRALFAFAASAPLMALATYWLLAAIPGLSSPVAVALCLSISGGTFLFAATMHVLPHVAEEHALSNAQVAVVLAGCAVPVAMQFLLGGYH